MSKSSKSIVLAGAVGLQQMLATANDPGDTKRDSIPLAAVSITAQTSAPVTDIYITHAVTDDVYSAEPPRKTGIVFKSTGDKS